jgi:CRP/FNR family transcriptional regulator, cyclic AMP receptor protein
MISPEVLRRYPFFALLDDSQLRAVAMLSEEVTFAKGDTIVKLGDPAKKVYLLLDGNLDLMYTIEEANSQATARDAFVGELSPGEPFGLSALIEPYEYCTTVRVASLECHVLMIDALGLRALCEANPTMGYLFMMRVAQAFRERLHLARIELVAARR